MGAEDVVNYLKAEKENIDKLIEDIIPRRVDERFMETLLGTPLYKYDAETFQKTVVDPLWDLLDRGGKRWRPWMFFTVLRCLGGDYDKYKYLGAAIEVIHNGSLVADDIEDRTTVRRGKKAIHLIFGEDVAVNLSSLMYFLPTKAIDDIDADPETYRRLSNTLHSELIRIHVGQATDIGWHAGMKDTRRITVPEYLQMCANKTGVLPRLACKWAGIASGLSEEDVEKLGRMGETIGVAFQIQDDIMNLTQAEGLGKEFGDDITEGKRTLMVIKVMEDGSEEDKNTLIDILNKHTTDIEEKRKVVEIFNKYNAFDYAKQVARRIVTEAWEEAEQVLPDNEYKEMLHSLALFCVERDR
ncbi:polyprenyl synthetase family protein [Candidatus Micrarchaeota archaeon]|nr:polyprenyl synthetase family protein [Candidatus Micrarchaeota archaeon]